MICLFLTVVFIMSIARKHHIPIFYLKKIYFKTKFAKMGYMGKFKIIRSEKRRVGKKCVSKCRYRW